MTYIFYSQLATAKALYKYYYLTSKFFQSLKAVNFWELF